MIELEVAQVKVPKRRTKSGCLTCRKRRIKCDEQRPICRNCSKQSRTCQQPAQPLVSLNLAKPGPSSRRSLGRGSIQKNQIEIHARDSSLPSASLQLTPGGNSTNAFSNSNDAYSQSPPESSVILHTADPATLMSSSSSRSDFNTIQGLPRTASFVARPNSSRSRHHSQQRRPSKSQLPNSEIPSTTSNASTARSDHDRSIKTSQSTYEDSAFARLPVCSTTLDISSKRFDSINLTSRQRYYFGYFVNSVHLNFTSISEATDTTGCPGSIKLSDFWTLKIPRMAMHSEPLLHAILAISALQEANIHNRSEHEALLDYHQAIRKLAKAFRDRDARNRDDLFAACLILAYFETMSGETVKWGRHLQGACDIVRYRISRAPISQAQSAFSLCPTTAEHLLWFHIHQDTIQSMISGNGLFLGLEWILRCPVRGEPGTITHASDQLRVFLARIGDFVCRDRKRKEQGQRDLGAIQQAVAEWETLLQALSGWRVALPPSFSSSTIRCCESPVGEALAYSHPAIGSIQIMSLAAVLVLHRAHPNLSHVPAEATLASIKVTYAIGQDIIKMLSGIMMDFTRNETIEYGFHIKAMINAVLPVFLAGVALQAPDQRDYLEHNLLEIYRCTGWRSAVRVIQGLDVAWQRKSRNFDGMQSLDENPNIKREETSTSGEETRYVLMDKPETLNSAAGVLGRPVFSPDCRQATDSSFALMHVLPDCLFSSPMHLSKSHVAFEEISALKVKSNDSALRMTHQDF